MGIVNGTLLAYYEQGWHGRIEFFFQPDDSTEFFSLKSGQRLTIFDEDGKILWSGKLEFVKRGVFDWHSYVWANTKQKSVSYVKWMDWFWMLPPLQAELEMMEANITEKPKDHPDINRYIHPPIVTLFYIALAYLLGFVMPLPFAMPDILRNIGFLLIFIGFLLALAAFVELKKARTTLDPHGSVSQMVTSGIYRFTRNPIYVGFLCLVIGLPLNSGQYWGLILSPIFIITMNRLVIEREEAYLEKKFGEAYTGYKSSVRRWV